jgi:D-glycero-beta-D-manno-heptose-7-phosphate kinase
MRVNTILNSLRKLKVLVIGDLILDHYIWGIVERISPEAPIPVVNVKTESYILGGAANVALNIATLGASAALAGTIGEDKAAQHFKKLIDEHKISSDLLLRSAQAPTNIKTRVIAQRQQLCRLDYEASPSAYALEETSFLKALEGKIASYDAIILSDYAKGVLHSSLIQSIIHLAQSHGILITVDPKPSHKLDFRGASLLTPNRAESYQLAGLEPSHYSSYPAAAICKIIQERYEPKQLVITLGAEGMLLCEKGTILKHIPTYAREVFDVSGAGDTVIACLTLGLAVGADLEAAAHFANIAAGIVVNKVGTATASPQDILAYPVTNKSST